MRIDYPMADQLPGLSDLWTEAFGERAFWDTFLSGVFTADQCRCVTVSDRVVSALYWFDCSCGTDRIAYLYAVATGAAYRHRGLCRALMEDTHALLKSRGYTAAMLVPENEGLRRLYEKLGYETCTTVREFTCGAGEEASDLCQIGREEYAVLRRQYLPAGGVLQEGQNLLHLETMARFWKGENVVLAAFAEGDSLHCPELLGREEDAPGIVRSFGCTRGTFRVPGKEKSFAMFRPLGRCGGVPRYFGLAFD